MLCHYFSVSTTNVLYYYAFSLVYIYAHKIHFTPSERIQRRLASRSCKDCRITLAIMFAFVIWPERTISIINSIRATHNFRNFLSSRTYTHLPPHGSLVRKTVCCCQLSQSAGWREWDVAYVVDGRSMQCIAWWGGEGAWLLMKTEGEKSVSHSHVNRMINRICN